MTDPTTRDAARAQQIAKSVSAPVWNEHGVLVWGLLDQCRLQDAIQRALAEVRAETQQQYEALNWLVHLCHNVGRAGGDPEPGEWEAAEEAGRMALSQPKPEVQP